MTWLKELVTNPFLITSTSSWLIAQVIKVIINACVTKKLDWERLFGDGGMPSGHSATVSSLAVICALMEGTGSVAFAISAILAIVVCHDAMGVRREAGKQAAILNDLVEAFNKLSQDDLPEAKLKEFVGHTPVQVLAGVIIGIGNAFLMHALMVTGL